MSLKCLVCSKYKSATENFKFFSLTKERYIPWMTAIGRDPNTEMLSTKNCICSEHFRPEEILYKSGKRYLTPTAVPTLKLKRGATEGNKGEPLGESETLDENFYKRMFLSVFGEQLQDHTYCKFVSQNDVDNYNKILSGEEIVIKDEPMDSSMGELEADFSSASSTKPRKCAVIGCGSQNSNEEPECGLIAVPKDIKQRALWQSYLTKENDELTETSMICEKHFQKNDILRFSDGQNKQHRKLGLRLGAVPIKIGSGPEIDNSVHLNNSEKRKSKIYKFADNAPPGQVTCVLDANNIAFPELQYSLNMEIPGTNKRRRPIIYRRSNRGFSLGNAKVLSSYDIHTAIVIDEDVSETEVLRQILRKVIKDEQAKDLEENKYEECI